MANQGGSERQVQVEETVAVAVTRLQLEDTDQKGTQLRPPSSPRTADTAGASAHDSGAAAHAAAVKMESDCDEGQGAVAASARRSPASAWPASKSPSAAASRDHSHTTPMGAGAAVTPIATATTATASLTATATPPSPAVASQISKAATPVKLESHDSDYEPCQITFTPSPKREDPTPRARSRSRSRSISRSRSGSRSGSRSRGRGLISARNSESSASTPVPGTKSPPAAVKQRPLYGDLPDATEDARRTFEVLPDCTYASKWLGRNDEAMHCDCVRDIDPVTGINRACGTDCVNVATKIECPSDSLCGPDCQNQRFTNHRYADVSVFKTEKKGFGLRANADLRAGDFIYEYIGEVIGEQAFRRRMVQYDQEGIKHFYFMSLEAGVFVDATKKGNLGRFCNHSCNPNCYVDKWIVGDRLRMGIFAGTNIQAGEELVFNYNVDRYGADPQPCYCGEANCTGFIGGKTQTGGSMTLSNATIEALGLDDFDGTWDTAVVKKPRRKKADEGDEEYVDSVQPKELDEKAVVKVMASLRQVKEKWIAVKLLTRLQRATDERVCGQIARMHGYAILKQHLGHWHDDPNVVGQILDILDHFPRLSRNKIEASGIEASIQPLTESEDERVQKKAKYLLEEWSNLEMGYRIPKKKDGSAGGASTTAAGNAFNPFDRRDRGESDRDQRRSRSRSRSKSIEPPTGPRNPSKPSRNHHQYHPGPRQFRPGYGNPKHFHGHGGGPPPLPEGWFQHVDAQGRTYYYTRSGFTQWHRPTTSARQDNGERPQPKSATDDLQAIIDKITTEKVTPIATKNATPVTPADVRAVVEQPEKKEKKEKWRLLSEEKQMKLYSNTLHPHIMYVLNKYKQKLPREQLKKFGKELSHKLVSSDYKNRRVEDPTKISDKHAQKAKKYVKEFLDKAVVKHRHLEEKRLREKTSEGHQRQRDEGQQSTDPTPTAGEEAADPASLENAVVDQDGDLIMSPMEGSPTASPATGGNVLEDGTESGTAQKRKRETGDGNDRNASESSPHLDGTRTHEDTGLPSSPKKLRPNPGEEDEQPPPPPPPPPPPSGSPGEPSGQSSPATTADRTTARESTAGVPATDADLEDVTRTSDSPPLTEFAIDPQTDEQARKKYATPSDGYSHQSLDHEQLRDKDSSGASVDAPRPATETMHGTN